MRRQDINCVTTPYTDIRYTFKLKKRNTWFTKEGMVGDSTKKTQVGKRFRGHVSDDSRTELRMRTELRLVIPFEQ